MKRKIVELFLVVTIMILAFGCNKKEKVEKVVVTEDNATFFTYDYISSLVGDKIFPQMTYAYEVDKLVVVFEYKNLLEDESDSISVSDEEVNAIVDFRKKGYATREVRTDGKISKDDILSIDITGSIDGNPISDSLIDYEYKLGGDMIDELDERLVGVKVGETFELPSTFSTEYENKEYAGKNVNFSIKINGVITYNYPEENEELYSKMGEEYGEAGLYNDDASLREYLKNTLYESKLNAYKEKYNDDVWEKVLENTVVKKTPTFDYEGAYNQMYNYLERIYEESNTQMGDVNDYLASIGYKKSIYALSEETATRYVKEKLATLYIAKKEGITVSKEEYNDCVENFISNIPDYEYKTIEEFIESMGDSKYIFITERYYEVLYAKVRQAVLN